jgi:hypothetical protein
MIDCLCTCLCDHSKLESHDLGHPVICRCRKHQQFKCLFVCPSVDLEVTNPSFLRWFYHSGGAGGGDDDGVGVVQGGSELVPVAPQRSRIGFRPVGVGEGVGRGDTDEKI